MSSYDGRPTTTQMEQQVVLQKELDVAMATTQALLDEELPGLNRWLSRRDLDPLQRISRQAWNERAGQEGSLGPVDSAQARFFLPFLSLAITP